MQDRKEHKPWISKETIDLIVKRGKLQLKKNSSKAETLSESNLNTDTKSNKAEALSEFEDCCKLVQKAVRADKRKWLNEKGNLIQELADKGSIKEMFGETQLVCRKWCPQTTKLMSKDGQVLGRKEERLERWTEHFKQLLNPSNRCKACPSPIFEAAKDLEIDLGPIRLKEVIDFVRKLKNGKASGPDGISAEILKAHDGIAQVLWNIIDKSWETERLPEDWKVAQIVPLYKIKGKLTDCSNYRGISLLSVPGKLFTAVTLNRCKEALKGIEGRAVWFQEEQMLYRPTFCAETYH